jgi:hypothetical protein
MQLSPRPTTSPLGWSRLPNSSSRLAAQPGQSGDLGDRQLPFVVVVLGPSNGGRAEVPLPPTLVAPGPASGHTRVGTLDKRVSFHLGDGGE